jgi:hypothetical protein
MGSRVRPTTSHLDLPIDVLAERKMVDVLGNS